jgi:tetratricopeptide (TPR) repeat protein
LIHILHSAQSDPSETAYADIEAAYGLTGEISSEDAFGEREAILAQLAFLGWNHCRRFRGYPEAKAWEQRCVDHSLAQEPERDFLTLSVSQCSDDLKRRFLRDPAILVAVCQRLTRLQNQSPFIVARDGAELYWWLAVHGPDLGPTVETIRFFEGALALAVTVAEMHLGRSREWSVWFRRAQEAFEATVNAEASLAALDYVGLAQLHTRRRYAQVDHGIDDVIRRFKQLSMRANLLKAHFLRAVNWKELDRRKEALASLLAIQKDATLYGDLLTASLCAGNIAQLYGLEGYFGLAICYARIAARLAVRSGCGLAQATADGSLGELLRDQGDYYHATGAYRSAISHYEDLRMDSFSAYLRVLVAETLLLAGRDDEALSEILSALPVIERENLSSEAGAATGILREAIRRNSVNLETLRRFRNQLNSLGEE